jgi:acetylornithine deacetylase/succinyl-diaminopimelate desuccinylase-like protein
MRGLRPFFARTVPAALLVAATALAAVLLPCDARAKGRPEPSRPVGDPGTKSPDLAEGVRLLKEYLRIDTTNPPGHELPAADFLRAALKKEGIESEVFVSTPGRANLLARLPAAGRRSAPPLLLLHHMDVVAADRPAWTADPFGGEERDGYIWGRGALDTKTTGILHLMTLLRLKREGVPLDRDVLFLAVADEENGGRWGAQWMVEREWNRMKPGFVIDEGGFGLRGVLTPGTETVYATAVEEKKVFWLRVTAEGRSGHGSVPHTDNPNDVLRRALNRIELVFLRNAGRPPEVVRDMERRLPRVRKSPLMQAIRQNTVAVTSFVGWSGDLQDPKVNVIPSRAVATLDCRLLPDEDEDALLDRLVRSVDDARVRIEVVRRTQRYTPARDHRSPLLAALERSVGLHDPDALVVPFLLPVATDSRFFRAKGAVCLGLAPLVLDEEEYLLLHASDERVPTDRLEAAFRIMYDWVKIFCTENAHVPDRR